MKNYQQNLSVLLIIKFQARGITFRIKFPYITFSSETFRIGFGVMLQCTYAGTTRGILLLIILAC